MRTEREFTIFGRKKKTKEGREFMTYFTKPTEDSAITVRFTEEAGAPKETPANIIVKLSDANVAHKKYTTSTVNKNGEIIENTGVRDTLWINAWTASDNIYVDHSADYLFEE